MNSVTLVTHRTRGPTDAISLRVASVTIRSLTAELQTMHRRSAVLSVMLNTADVNGSAALIVIAMQRACRRNDRSVPRGPSNISRAEITPARPAIMAGEHSAATWISRTAGDVIRDRVSDWAVEPNRLIATKIFKRKGRRGSRRGQACSEYRLQSGLYPTRNTQLKLVL
jgi:hypothetical protein